jgi:hypothetical protein
MRKNKKMKKKKTTIKAPPTRLASSQFISNFMSSFQIVLVLPSDHLRVFPSVSCLLSPVPKLLLHPILTGTVPAF